MSMLLLGGIGDLIGKVTLKSLGTVLALTSRASRGMGIKCAYTCHVESPLSLGGLLATRRPIFLESTVTLMKLSLYLFLNSVVT